MQDPAERLADREATVQLKARIVASLSRFEAAVLALYLKKLDYKTIAAKLQTTEKAVDNALQRIRRKLRK